MKRLNNKGFTLVELLAVIVILSVVMLIAVTAVGPLMTKARKSALGTEGLGLMEAAQTAYQSEQMLGTGVSKDANGRTCFSISWLYKNGFYKKGNGTDNYSGSVLVTHTSDGETYKFWISNGTYAYEGIDEQTYNKEGYGKASEKGNASANCGSAGSLYNS